MEKSRAWFGNVDDDGLYEVIIYDGDEKIFQGKVRQITMELLPITQITPT
jgi:hypothetical protein